MIAVSPSTRDDLARRGVDPQRIEVIENGVDAVRFVPGPEEGRFDDPTILYVGRLKRYKRVDLVLRAAAALRAEGLPVRLLIAGEGDRRPALQREARRLGLGEGAAHFLEWVSEGEKVRLLQRSWVHVLTSEKEGWGISILEAAACGTPSVASDVPGLRDSVLHEKSGLLVPHGDVKALAGSIRRLLVSPDLRREMGREGRRFAEELTWERAAARLGKSLRAAVAAPVSRR
jgi:glycosyltransferase involved in cell wall biosynthesis